LTVVAQVRNQAIVIGCNPRHIFTTGLAVHPKWIILGPAFLRGFLSAVLGLILGQYVEYIQALFDRLLYSVVIQAAPVRRRFTNILWMNTEPVHCPLKFRDKSRRVRVKLSPGVWHITERTTHILLHRPGSV